MADHDHDPEQFERELHKATQFPWPFERLHQEGLMFESAYVAHPGRVRFIVYSLPVRFVLMLGSVFVVGRTDGWLQTLAGLVLVTFAALGVGAPLRRAQAYRSGWLDRGNHDVTEHELVCGDAETLDHRNRIGEFRGRMQQLNMDALL